MSAKKKFQKNRREAGRFIQIPCIVLESANYLRLSAHAKSLLWDIASQYKGDNNGSFLIGWTFMSEERGWKSPDTLNNAKKELMASSLIVETRKGARPNKSTWIGITWWHLNHRPEMDINEQDFPRGEYDKTPLNVKKIATLSTDTVQGKINNLSTDTVQLKTR